MDEMNLDNIIEEVDTEIIPEIEINPGAVAIAVGVGAAAIGGIAFLAYKYRHKFEEWNVKRLEKKGYVVTKAGVKNDSDFDDIEEV